MQVGIKRLRRKLRAYFPEVLLPLLAMLILGGACASPVTAGVVVGAVGLVAAGAFLLLRPPKALLFSFFLIMLADTKFRIRDPNALLSGDIDSQIIFELVLHSIVALITLTNLPSIPLQRLKPTPMELALFGYIALALVSSFWSCTFRITAVRGVQLWVFYAFCFVAVRVLGPPAVLRILPVTAILYVLLCSVLALAFSWASSMHLSQTSGLQRFSWFAVHPSIAAAYAATAAIFIISEALFAQDSWRRRFMGFPRWAYLIPLVLILIATRSRGQLIAFVIAVSVLWVRKSVNPWIVGFVGYMVLVLSGVLLGAGFSVIQVMGDLLRDDSSLTAFLLRGQTVEGFLSLSGRTELWSGVYALVSHRPIFGYGYVASRSVLLQVLPWAGHAHNALAETLLDLGIVGTALIWFALARTLLSSLLQTSGVAPSRERQRASILGILLFLLVDSFVSPSFGGAPAYEVLLFFATVFASDGLRRATRSILLPRQFANGTLPVARWQLAQGDLAHES